MMTETLSEVIRRDLAWSHPGSAEKERQVTPKTSSEYYTYNYGQWSVLENCSFDFLLLL